LLYLVRHAETEWNVARRLQGRRDSPLTPLGERQAAAMAELLGELVEREPPAAWRLVSSPLGRTQRTAAAISARLGLPVDLDERLAEIAFGDWEGQLRDEVAPLHREHFATSDWAPPGGETFDDVLARAGAWLDEQPAEPARRVIAVTHGVTSRVLRGRYVGLARPETLALEAPQGAVYRLANGQVDRFDSEPLEA